MSDLPEKRLIIIEDDPIWRRSIEKRARRLKYDCFALTEFSDYHDFDDLAFVIDRELHTAERQERPYTLAIIDANFRLGDDESETLLGVNILDDIKSAYPYIACVMVTGSPEMQASVLELRDDYSLDGFIMKGAFLDAREFAIKIERACEHAVENFQKREMAAVPTTSSAPEDYNLSKIRRLLNTFYSETDLKDLCFDLGVSYQSIAGRTLGDKIRELIIYMDQRNQISEMINMCQQIRPDVKLV